MIFGRIGWAIAGAGLGVALFTGAMVYAYQRGAESERLDAMRRSVEILRERSKNDAAIRNMSDRDLCIELGGVPDECAGI